jgi:hypothetical protein
MRLHRNSEWHTVSEAITNLAVEVRCAEASTMYLFRVRAHNALGCSLWSDEAMFETLAPPPPLAPQGLAATGTHESVTLNWLHYQSGTTGYDSLFFIGLTASQISEECTPKEVLKPSGN